MYKRRLCTQFANMISLWNAIWARKIRRNSIFVQCENGSSNCRWTVKTVKENPFSAFLSPPPPNLSPPSSFLSLAVILKRWVAQAKHLKIANIFIERIFQFIRDIHPFICKTTGMQTIFRFNGNSNSIRKRYGMLHTINLLNLFLSSIPFESFRHYNKLIPVLKSAHSSRLSSMSFIIQSSSNAKLLRGMLRHVARR